MHWFGVEIQVNNVVYFRKMKECSALYYPYCICYCSPGGMKLDNNKCMYILYVEECNQQHYLIFFNSNYTEFNCKPLNYEFAQCENKAKVSNIFCMLSRYNPKSIVVSQVVINSQGYCVRDCNGEQYEVESMS